MRVARRARNLLFLLLGPLLVWGLASRVFESYLVPPPHVVFRIVADSSLLYLEDSILTGLEALLGLLLATSISFLIAVTLRLFPGAEKVVMPYAIALKSVPVVALAPLLVMAFGNGPAGKVALAALVCFFPLLVGTLDGFKSLPWEFEAMASVWSASRWRRLLLIEIPYGAPYFASSFKVASPLAVVGAVVAEFSGSDSGLGHAILVSAYRADTASLYAGIIIVSFVGIAFFAMAAQIEKWMLIRLGTQNGTV